MIFGWDLGGAHVKLVVLDRERTRRAGGQSPADHFVRGAARSDRCQSCAAGARAAGRPYAGRAAVGAAVGDGGFKAEPLTQRRKDAKKDTPNNL